MQSDLSLSLRCVSHPSVLKGDVLDMKAPCVYLGCGVSALIQSTLLASCTIQHCQQPPEKRFAVMHSRADFQTVNVSCNARGVYPEPKIFLYIVAENKTKVAVPGVEVETTARSGEYDIQAVVLLPDSGLDTPTVFLCELRIPETSYSNTKTITYHPGNTRNTVASRSRTEKQNTFMSRPHTVKQNTVASRSRTEKQNTFMSRLRTVNRTRKTEHIHESPAHSKTVHGRESLANRKTEHIYESPAHSKTEHGRKALANRKTEHIHESPAHSKTEHGCESLANRKTEHIHESPAHSKTEHGCESLANRKTEHIHESPAHIKTTRRRQRAYQYDYQLHYKHVILFSEEKIRRHEVDVLKTFHASNTKHPRHQRCLCLPTRAAFRQGGYAVL
ncbi:hypothetical protein J6590_038421 [Homalodisca vitripennis]|nr:hypothetical protein J6590_038421 [Homalodisca vitripennis]